MTSVAAYAPGPPAWRLSSCWTSRKARRSRRLPADANGQEARGLRVDLHHPNRRHLPVPYAPGQLGGIGEGDTFVHACYQPTSVGSRLTVAAAGCWWSARWRGGNPYVTYAPDGITLEQLLGRVRDMWESIRLFSPSARVEPVKVLGNSGDTTLNWSSRSESWFSEPSSPMVA